MYTVYKILLHSPKLMRRTFPKEPCPSTFRSSNCCGSAFSEPSLTRCVMLISLIDTSSWREDDNKPERELNQRETQKLWQTVQTKPEKRSPAREKALLLNSPTHSVKWTHGLNMRSQTHHSHPRHAHHSSAPLWPMRSRVRPGARHPAPCLREKGLSPGNPPAVCACCWASDAQREQD